ncbi:hypothetical protein [Vibrio lentus]|uniref:hypothetical protein n=1 Tax=Vibrio lentus TaxID=136468 RepID=UPI00178D036C|nr:hypothetical protein [Vibrio lentus]MDN3631442.1 hypothetical protein [Vibrio lentus]
MKVLYFDPLTTLYSHAYINSNKEVKSAFFNEKFMGIKQTLLNVTPDHKSARMLADVAQSVGALLYPTTPQSYPRELLIQCGIFNDNQLAPFIDLSLRLRLDDADWLRTTRKHAELLNAGWYVCGDFEGDKRTAMPMCAERVFYIDYENGIDEHTINKIRRAMMD